jgi:hypothetical protein
MIERFSTLAGHRRLRHITPKSCPMATLPLFSPAGVSEMGIQIPDSISHSVFAA